MILPLLEKIAALATSAGQLAGNGVAAALRALFAPPSASPWPRRLAFLFVAFLGLAHWHWFFSGPLALDFEDWPKERAYLDLLREAIVTRTPPLHMDVSLQMTQRFLALPETMLAPHALLLPFLSNQQFIILQTCLMFLAGLAGTSALARRFEWNAFAFAAFTVVFSFNGFITCRLACGHFMWAGYYLFPWMLLATLRLIEKPDTTRRWLELSGVIFALFLVGSFHLAVWWMLFLIVLALCRPRLLLPIGTALAVAGALCLFRIAPAAVTFGGLHREFGSGYPDLLVLARAFVQSLGYDTPFVPTPRATLGWWEFNHFVGLPATLFALLYTLKRPATSPSISVSDSDSQLSTLDSGPSDSPSVSPSQLSTLDSGLSATLLPAAVLAILSLSQFYAPIASLPLPLFNSERITTRFISVAFFVFFFVACTRFNRDSAKLSPGWQALALALLAQTAIELAYHSAQWRPIALEATHGPSTYWENSATMTAHIERVPQEMKYKLAVAASWAFSALALLATALAWLRLGPRVVTPMKNGS